MYQNQSSMTILGSSNDPYYPKPCYIEPCYKEVEMYCVNMFKISATEGKCCNYIEFDFFLNMYLVLDFNFLMQ